MATPQKFPCQVKNVVAHGERVYTLELVPDVLPVPRFKSGQFFHLALDPYDPTGFWPDSRVFSIASSPRERDKIQFTYSVRGRYTARMEEEIIAGRQVWVKMPYGEFFVDVSHPVVLFAGGTGITAFTAFLHDLVDSPPHPVTVFYGARQKNLLVYRSLVEAIWSMVGELALKVQTGNTKGYFKRCHECDTPFLATDKRQQFCPRPEGDLVERNQSLCGLKYRQRNQKPKDGKKGAKHERINKSKR